MPNLQKQHKEREQAKEDVLRVAARLAFAFHREDIEAQAKLTTLLAAMIRSNKYVFTDMYPEERK